MSFQVAGVVNGLKERIQDGSVPVGWSVNEDVKYGGSQVENGHVIYVVADVLPCPEQAGDAIPPGFGDARHVVVRCGEPEVESQGVEHYQATDAQGFGAISFPVGLRDNVPDAAGGSRVGGEFYRRLLDGMLDDGGGRDHAVGAFQFQRQHAQVVGDVSWRTETRAQFRSRFTPGTVEPPFKVAGVLKSLASIFQVFQPFGVEDADDAQRIGKLPQSSVQLAFQLADGIIPLAFQQHSVAGLQRDANVGSRVAVAAFGASSDALVAEQLGEEGVDRFLTDDFPASVAGESGVAVSSCSGHKQASTWFGALYGPGHHSPSAVVSSIGGSSSRVPNDGRRRDCHAALAMTGCGK